jgi:hypothetical protein
MSGAASEGKTGEKNKYLGHSVCSLTQFFCQVIGDRLNKTVINKSYVWVNWKENRHDQHF